MNASTNPVNQVSTTGYRAAPRIRLHRNRAFVIFGLIYLGGAGIHLSLAISNPNVYEGLAETSLLPVYGVIFTEIFPSNPVLFALLAAVVEGIVGLLIIVDNRYSRLGLAGGIVLQTLFTPLGWWGFLNILLVAVQAYVLARDLPRDAVVSAAEPPHTSR